MVLIQIPLKLRIVYQDRLGTVVNTGWFCFALGEEPVGPARSNCPNGRGGTWSALMWAAKMISINASAKDSFGVPPAARAMPTKSVVPTKVAALVAKWPVQPPAPTISTASDGKITIPAVLFSSKNRSASLTTMQSAGPGEQLMHNGETETKRPFVCSDFPLLIVQSVSWQHLDSF
jgi:hypothetical protein